MAKLLGGLMGLALLLVAGLVILGAGTLDRQAAAQRRRHEQELHEVQLVVERERAVQAIAESRQLQPVKTAALGMGLMASAFTALGAGFYLVAELRKRTLLVWPNKAGIFPQVTVELPNGARAFHDPNRSPVATMVYSPTRDGGVSVTPVILPGLADSVRQAAAVQLTTAAVHRGTPLTKDAQDVARRFLPARSEQTEVQDGTTT